MMFASELGLKPWELGRLDYEQLQTAVSKFDEMIAEAAARAAQQS